ncbi:MAG: hypothetical protein ACTSUE_13095 [Promethearchaeota archaeon]
MIGNKRDRTKEGEIIDEDEDEAVLKKRKLMSTSVRVVFADLLNHGETYLMHQVNCTARKSHGLSKQVFTRYPSADIYDDRKHGRIGTGVPGTVDVRKNEGVINMLGQYFLGYWKTAKQKNDRFKWFKMCLSSLESYFRFQKKLVTIAFPFRIGCGLAGGDWNIYFAALKKCNQKQESIEFVMYVFKGDEERYRKWNEGGGKKNET